MTSNGSSARRQPGAAMGQTRKTRSILDSVTQEVARLEQRLGSSDRGKLGEYLQAVRDIEQRVASLEKRGEQSAAELPERPMEMPEFWDDRAKLLFDLQVLAFQADITRVVTMLMGRELSGQTFPQIGVPEQHHSCSHHINNPKPDGDGKPKIEAITRAVRVLPRKAARDARWRRHALDHSFSAMGRARQPQPA